MRDFFQKHKKLHFQNVSKLLTYPASFLYCKLRSLAAQGIDGR